MAEKDKNTDGQILEGTEGSPLEGVSVRIPIPADFSKIFPASGSVADASIIGSAEGSLDLSTPGDPTGESMVRWLKKVSAGIDPEIAKLTRKP